MHTNFIDDESGNQITDPSISANVLNDHFCLCFQTVQLDNQLDNDSNESIILSDSIEEKLQNISHFVIPTVSLSFVETQLQSLDTCTSKSTGSDGLSGRFLKMSASVIALVFRKITTIV